MAPVGVEKTQPWMETTSFTASPEMPLVVKFEKVVADVVWMVIITGAKMGVAPSVAAGGTKKTGRVASVKLKALALIPATVPVIWLGSKAILLAVKRTSGGPTGLGPFQLLLPELTAGVTVPCNTTCTSCPTCKSDMLAKVNPEGIVKLPESIE